LTADFAGPQISFALAAALLMGATCPQVGPLARVRWMAMTRNNKQELDTALSYESTADELTFVLGPALVGLLAALVAPWLPFALAATLTIVMVSAFAVHPTYRSVQPVPQQFVERHPQAAAAAKTPVNWGVVVIPVAGMIAMGTFFGASQNALNAFGGSFGAADTAGLLYAVLGLSSAVTALSVAYWPETFSHASRWTVSAAAMAVLSLLLLLPTEVVPMLVVLLLVGLPVGPTMVTIFTIGGKVAPDERLGTVMTLLASGVVLGSALGSGVAGAIAETYGYQGAFIVAVGACVAMLAVSILGAIMVRNRS
ncbi:MAG TPA: MFS transporter, partial [Arthrobacter sp.]|nr:MFS transporter [Arthrobacter sp.]